MEKDYFVGEIGKNVPKNTEEKEEDLLEELYSRWQQGDSMEVVDVMIDLNLKRREIGRLLKRMEQHGYLVEAVRSGTLELTSFGKIQGAECMMRHQSLTQFLQLVSGMGLEEAQENACRMEHVMNGKGIQGISDFIKYGDIYDRIMENLDLRMMYDEGNYPVCFGLYRMDKREPRELAEEFDLLEDEATLEVAEKRSWFYIQKQENAPFSLWYLRRTGWKRAEERADGWLVPTQVFTFTVSAGMPVIDGTLVVALAGRESEPTAADCREMNVHL